MACTWEDLAAMTLARQLPPVDGRDAVTVTVSVAVAVAVAETMGRIGPIQAQTARSPFLRLAADPGRHA